MRKNIVIVILISFIVLPAITEAGGIEEDRIIQKKYLSGRAYFRAGDYELAVKQFEAVIKIDPNYKVVAEYLKLSKTKHEVKSKREAELNKKREILKEIAMKREEREEARAKRLREVSKKVREVREDILKNIKKTVEKSASDVQGAWRRLITVKKRISVGIENTYVAEREFEHAYDTFVDGGFQVESFQHKATLSYELLNGLTLKGKLGEGRIKNNSWKEKIKDNAALGFIGGWHDYKIAWGAGGDWNLSKFVNTCYPEFSLLPWGINLIISGEYAAIEEDTIYTYHRASLADKWQEFNTSITLSRKWRGFTPYAGARLSFAQIKSVLHYNLTGVENFSGTLKAEDNFGGFLGLKLDNLLNSNMSIYGEVNAFDQFGFNGGITYNY